MPKKPLPETKLPPIIASAMPYNGWSKGVDASSIDISDKAIREINNLIQQRGHVPDTDEELATIRIDVFRKRTKAAKILAHASGIGTHAWQNLLSQNDDLIALKISVSKIDYFVEQFARASISVEVF